MKYAPTTTMRIIRFILVNVGMATTWMVLVIALLVIHTVWLALPVMNFHVMSAWMGTICKIAQLSAPYIALLDNTIGKVFKFNNATFVMLHAVHAKIPQPHAQLAFSPQLPNIYTIINACLSVQMATSRTTKPGSVMLVQLILFPSNNLVYRNVLLLIVKVYK